jgi:hypothetical protein
LPNDQTTFLATCDGDANLRVFSMAGDSLQFIYTWQSGVSGVIRGVAFFPNDQ